MELKKLENLENNLLEINSNKDNSVNYLIKSLKNINMLQGTLYTQADLYNNPNEQQSMSFSIDFTQIHVNYSNANKKNTVITFINVLPINGAPSISECSINTDAISHIQEVETHTLVEEKESGYQITRFAGKVTIMKLYMKNGAVLNLLIKTDNAYYC